MNKKEKDLILAFEDNLNKRLFIARFGTKGIYKAMKEELDLLIAKAIDDYKNSDDAARWIENKITEAIAEHEQSKWKKYPDNLPEIGPTYLIQRKGDNIQITSSAYTYWSRLDVIAFRELPKPYQEERQSFGNTNGCHNCKHQDNDDVCKKCDDTWDKWEGGEK